MKLVSHYIHHIVAYLFSRQQSPDQAVQMSGLIWVLAVLMWHRDISHIAAFFLRLNEDMHIFFFLSVCLIV